MSNHPLGPRGPAVEAFLSEVDSVRWFSAVGSPVSDPGIEQISIERVGLDFLVANYGDEWLPWGSSMLDAERLVWDEIMRQGLLAEQERVQQLLRAWGETTTFSSPWPSSSTMTTSVTPISIHTNSFQSRIA